MNTQQFRDDDDGYLAWLAQHPRGYVVNCYRRPTAGYVELHRARCTTICGRPKRGVTWTRHQYIKICATDVGTLNRWALEEVGTFPTPCGVCRPG